MAYRSPVPYVTSLHKDILTSVANGCYFGQRLDQAVSLQRQWGVSFAVLLVEVENLAAVRDKLGEGMAGRLLQEVVARLLMGTRRMDVVARLSEARFGILLTGVAIQEARLVAERLAAEINGTPVWVDLATATPITPMARIRAASLADGALK